jgi:hypothetical protein
LDAPNTLISEDIPEDSENPGPVIKIVGKSHKRITTDENKHVMVLYCTPGVQQCEEFYPIWNQLAQELQEFPDVLMGKMNLSKNKAADLGEIKYMPLVILYPTDHKEGIRHYGTMKLEDLKTFVDKEVNYYSFKKSDL